MKNWTPLIVVLALIALLGLLFGPGIYRGMLLKGSVSQLLAAAQEGRTTDILALVTPTQQREAASLLGRHLHADYHQSIGSLRLTRTRKSDGLNAVTIVTCRIEQGEYVGIYQGQLVWHYTGGRWEWDFLASSGAEFMPAGEPSWIKLSDLLPLAERL